ESGSGIKPGVAEDRHGAESGLFAFIQAGRSPQGGSRCLRVAPQVEVQRTRLLGSLEHALRRRRKALRVRRRALCRLPSLSLSNKGLWIFTGKSKRKDRFPRPAWRSSPCPVTCVGGHANCCAR